MFLAKKHFMKSKNSAKMERSLLKITRGKYYVLFFFTSSEDKQFLQSCLAELCHFSSTGSLVDLIK